MQMATRALTSEQLLRIRRQFETYSNRTAFIGEEQLAILLDKLGANSSREAAAMIMTEEGNADKPGLDFDQFLLLLSSPNLNNIIASALTPPETSGSSGDGRSCSSSSTETDASACDNHTADSICDIISDEVSLALEAQGLCRGQYEVEWVSKQAVVNMMNELSSLMGTSYRDEKNGAMRLLMRSSERAGHLPALPVPISTVVPANVLT